MSKSFIIYFSRADENYEVGYLDKGNTQVIAEYIERITGAPSFKVEPLNPYAKDYVTCLSQAKERQRFHTAPIQEKLPDLSSYEVIYLGSPVYWEYLPEEMVTALQEINLKGKMIRPFITHEGSQYGKIPVQLAQLCRGATIQDALVIRGSFVKQAEKNVEDWISKWES